MFKHTSLLSLYFMQAYLAPPLRSHQGQTAGGEGNVALGVQCYGDIAVGGDVCCMVFDYVCGMNF